MNSLYFLLCVSAQRLAVILTVVGLVFDGSIEPLQARTLAQPVSAVRESNRTKSGVSPTKVASHDVNHWNFQGDGQPGGRGDAGNRGDCPYLPTVSLTALMPDTNLALTLSEHPTFWFYIPYTTAQYQRATFVLEDPDKNLVDPLTIELSIELSGIPGIMSVTLPATTQPLELDREYYWDFSLECSATDPAKNPRVNGWVKRVSPDSQTLEGKVSGLVTPEELAELLVQREQTQTPRERFLAYATHHIWSEALTEIARDRQDFSGENPLWPDRDKDWLDLLRSVNCEPLNNTDIFCTPTEETDW